MTHRFSHLMFTPAVRAVQEAQGSRRAYERLEAPEADPRDTLGEAERAFIAARAGSCLPSVSEIGWPYVQHRGGPPGFLKTLDDRTPGPARTEPGFADFRGNHQYASVGNLDGNDRAPISKIGPKSSMIGRAIDKGERSHGGGGEAGEGS